MCVSCTKVNTLWTTGKTKTGFPGGAVVKNWPANARDARHSGWRPGSGRSLGVGNDNLLQYPGWNNHMKREV